MNAYPHILDELGRGRPVSMSRTGGGCISDSMVAAFADGSKAFVKCLDDIPGLFECEATGLRVLASTGVIRVPQVLAVEPGALILDYIEPAPRLPDFFASFGRSLARLHTVTGPACGFSEDNFIGSMVQINTPLSGGREVFSQTGWPVGDGSDWPEFFFDRRLHFQVKRATSNGRNSELARLLDLGERQMKELLSGAIEPPSLLHGDLWGGNFLVDDAGEACLIDPAVYYGHRETDLAMTQLFGGFEASFYRAYNEQFPLPPGYEQRRPLYQLYHLLNHLNLFGNAYYSQCQQILQRYSSTAG